MTKWENDIARIIVPTPFAVGDVNCFVIKGDALTLVDVGPKTEEGKQALLAGLENLKLKLSDFDQVIVTHHHPDHVGGLDFFPPQTTVIGHEYNNRWMNVSEEFEKKYAAFFSYLGEQFGLPAQLSLHTMRIPDRKYKCNRKLTHLTAEAQSIHGLEGWHVFETPGHAMGHIVLLRESDGALIGGDMLLQKVSPNPIIEPPLVDGEERPKSLLLLNDSLRRLADLPIHTVYAGHGDTIANPKELIQTRLAEQHKRAMKVKEMLQKEPGTVFQVCMKLFPKAYKRELGLTLSETAGQIDYLIDIGEIQEEATERGTIYYVK